MVKKKKPVFEKEEINVAATMASTRKFMREQFPWIKQSKKHSKIGKRAHRRKADFISC